jgi:hypothetical protein
MSSEDAGAAAVRAHTEARENSVEGTVVVAKRLEGSGESGEEDKVRVDNEPEHKAAWPWEKGASHSHEAGRTGVDTGVGDVREGAGGHAEEPCKVAAAWELASGQESGLPRPCSTRGTCP